MEISMNKNTKAFICAAEKKFGKGATLTRANIDEIVNDSGVPYPYWLTTNSKHRAGRGFYKVPVIDGAIHTVRVEKPEPMTVDMSAQVVVLRQPKLQDESDASIPEKYPDYVPFGFFKDLRNIVKSSLFYPVFITGLSGNGKTLMVEQVCAELQRECIRVNISIETDESDLLGGPTLVNGNVVNRDGPVIIAMKRGAILLIDEVDRGSNKLMCLQGILEGKPYYNKKSGELVHPAPGFNIIATANTKGRGSDEGKYLSQILDDAFLERFPITVEQEYPDKKTETRILNPLIKDEDFVECLVNWADTVRRTFDEGGTDEIISTRRLVHIAKAYDIFGDRMKAITLCVNRFDDETKTAFLDLYTKVDAKINAPKVGAAPAKVPSNPDEEVPF
jgi:AAA domain (dynein-related subfamily)/CbbQ/NirQ/NorQ C-terminal